MTKKTTLILPLLAAAAIAAGCGGGKSSGGAASAPTAAKTSAATGPATGSPATTSAPAATAAVAVDIAGFAFKPAAIQAKVGQTITFTNRDSTAHTATATSGASFDSGALEQGKSFSFTTAKAGTIQFVCSFHPGMTGTITVS